LSTPVLSSSTRSIAFFRALQLGDLLCAIPAVRALRHAAPEASLTLIGLPWARAFAARFSQYFDAFLEFPGAHGIPERQPDAQRRRRFFADMRERRFDLAVQAHGNGSTSNRFVMQLAASRTVGFRPGGPEEAPCRSFLPYPREGHEVRRLLRLAEHL